YASASEPVEEEGVDVRVVGIRVMCGDDDAGVLRAGGSELLVHAGVCVRMRDGIRVRVPAGRVAVRRRGGCLGGRRGAEVVAREPDGSRVNAAILFEHLPAMAEAVPLEIPNRALFKASEVCDLVKLQPYVLRSWEVEFPGLGVAK